MFYICEDFTSSFLYPWCRVACNVDVRPTWKGDSGSMIEDLLTSRPIFRVIPDILTIVVQGESFQRNRLNILRNPAITN